MKNLKLNILFFLSAGIAFTSCNEDTPDVNNPTDAHGAYIINYGNYGEGGASISKFDYENDEITNNYYYNQNDGLELISNIQYACEYNENIYMMGNNSDEIIITDRMFKQSIVGITDGISKPRFSVGKDDYLYISCWGENADWDIMPDSYVAKFNITTNEVEEKIEIPGGPEGLAIVDNNLYVALNYADSIAVVDLNDESTSYIQTPAVTSYFLKDNSNNLYVSLVSTYSDFSDAAGLGYINTSNNNLEETYTLNGISTEYTSIFSFNSDYSKIYVLGTHYDENWNVLGSVSVFDIESKAFTNFIDDISSPKGVTVNPENGDIYLFIAESVVEGGTFEIYNEAGELQSDYNVGNSPTMSLFLY
ncbi:MAG: hypothetical protein PF486_13225 [Prolixibacteraceae bacterium]|jgi:hypothetical protein|nr:hypothetical protein [Prolixibacteraceae bacterium]